MHLAGWFEVLRDAYAVEPYYLIARDDSGKVCGILPGYKSNSMLMGKHYTTLDGGALAESDAVRNALVDAAKAIRSERGIKFVQIRGGITGEDAPSRLDVIHTVIPTGRGADAAWAAVKQKTRWGVRQAEKQELEVHHDIDFRDLESFYNVYAAHMHELGTPCFGVKTFRAMQRRFGAARLRLYVIRYRGNLVGGMICLVHGNHWSDLHAIVRRDETPEFANYLLYWHVIRDAAQNGVTDLDLGQSDPGGNVHLFKRKWGGYDVDLPYFTYPTLEKPKTKANVLHKNPPKGMVRKIWSRLPLPVCNFVGPIMRRDLPFGLY